ncbi:hypothetical protein B0H13DRAFT_1873574 [Mycena leptocephala]|nr:hypothetical protein B0H13DRAFT_1873574 [Mycena leptocephala]
MSFAESQSQSGQRYTMCTNEEWLHGLDDPVDPPLSALDIDPTQFLDSISNSLGLDPEGRSDLHQFSQIFSSLPQDHRLALAFQQGTILQTQKLIRAATADYAGIKEALKDVKEALAQNTGLTKDQMTEINAVCKLIVWDPLRTDYDNDDLGKEANKRLEKNQKTNGMKTICDATAGQARKRALRQAIGRGASYAKSSFRKLLWDSINPESATCLTLTVTNASRKLTGSTENVKSQHAVNMLILRQFGRDNQHLLADKKSNKRPRDDSTRPNHEDSDSDRDTKFWEAVTKFHDTNAKEWGTDRKSPGWTGYINNALTIERRLFPNDAIPLLPITQTVTERPTPPPTLPPLGSDRLAQPASRAFPGPLQSSSGLSMFPSSSSHLFTPARAHTLDASAPPALDRSRMSLQNSSVANYSSSPLAHGHTVDDGYYAPSSSQSDVNSAFFNSNSG